MMQAIIPTANHANRIYKIGIIEEDTQFSEDLIMHLSQSHHLSTCLNTDSSSAAVRILYNQPALYPDLLLIGIQGSDIKRMEEIVGFKELKPEMLVVLLTLEENRQIIQLAFDKGADGYLVKSEHYSNMERKLLHMLEYGQPAVSQQIFRYMLYRNKDQTRVAKGKLTKKEKEITEMVLEGLTYKEIAARQQLSLNTVQYHMKNIFLKLDVKTKAELFKIYFH